MAGSIPVVVEVSFLLTFFVACSQQLIFRTHFRSCKHTCTDQSRLKISGREAIGGSTKSFKPNNSIGADAVDEGDDTGQNLDLEFGDQEGAVVHINLQQAGLIVSRGQGLAESDK